MSKVLSAGASVLGGILGLGFGIVWVLVSIGMFIGGLFFLSWLSDVFYAWGWWPIGAILRVVVWLMIAGVVLAVGGIVIALLWALLMLVTSPFRRRASNGD